MREGSNGNVQHNDFVSKRSSASVAPITRRTNHCFNPASRVTRIQLELASKVLATEPPQQEQPIPQTPQAISSPPATTTTVHITKISSKTNSSIPASSTNRKLRLRSKVKAALAKLRRSDPTSDPDPDPDPVHHSTATAPAAGVRHKGNENEQNPRINWEMLEATTKRFLAVCKKIREKESKEREYENAFAAGPWC